MSRGRDEDGGGFLSRWSRLKQEAREKEARPQEPEAEPEPDTAPLPEEPEPHPPAVADEEQPPAAAGAEAEAPPLDLPDIETLTRDSDYTAFLRAEVPAELRKQALRKLWRSDPVFANLDGLNDYDENYGAPAIVGAAVRTAYDVIKGFTPRDMQAGEATAEAAEGLDAAPQHSDAAAQYTGAAPEQSAEETPPQPSGASAEAEDKPDEFGPISGENSKNA